MLGSLAIIVASCASPPATTPNATPTPAPTDTTPASAVPTATFGPAPTQFTASATPASSIPSGPVGFGWTTVTLQAEIQALTADGNQFVAAGTSAGGQVAFTSPDGSAWTRMAVPPPTGLVDPSSGLPPNTGASYSRMGPLVRLDTTLYSFGTFSFMDAMRPVGWRWTDGATWEFIKSGNPFFSTGTVFDAASGDDAIAVMRGAPALRWSDTDTTSWSWRSGTSWVAGDLSANDTDRVAATEVASSTDGFLATGNVLTGDDAAALTVPVTWSSTDGNAWTQVAPSGWAGQVCALEADPNGSFMAVSVEPNRAAGWTWNAGYGWQSTTLPGSTGIPTTQGNPFAGLCAMVQVGGRVVALVGYPGGAMSWTRDPTGSWLAGPAIPGSNLGLAAALGDKVVVLESVISPTGGQNTTIVHVGVVQP